MKQKHSDRLVAEMEQDKVSYFAVPGRGHCDMPKDMWDQYGACIYEAVEAGSASEN